MHIGPPDIWNMHAVRCLVSAWKEHSVSLGVFLGFVPYLCHASTQAVTMHELEWVLAGSKSCMVCVDGLATYKRVQCVYRNCPNQELSKTGVCKERFLKMGGLPPSRSYPNQELSKSGAIQIRSLLGENPKVGGLGGLPPSRRKTKRFSTMVHRRKNASKHLLNP